MIIKEGRLYEFSAFSMGTRSNTASENTTQPKKERKKSGKLRRAKGVEE
jgi:hypothetical protein